MLEKPSLPDELILSVLRAEYGLRIDALAFLPLGADQNTAVYRARAGDGRVFFVKLRLGDFSEIAVRLPAYLHALGIQEIIAPVQTRAGQLWVDTEAFHLVLYPFIDGRDGYKVGLTREQWRRLGAALKQLHTLHLPEDLCERIPREAYSAAWRKDLRETLTRLDEPFSEPASRELVRFLRKHLVVTRDLLERAERRAGELIVRPRERVLCHSDLHAGNILIGSGGRLYLVDWDNPILAPKERDLMFFGGGQGFITPGPRQEQKLFYRGYGPTALDGALLEYYRCERIVQDLAVFSRQILDWKEGQTGGEDRAQALAWLKSNYAPGGTIELAFQSDQQGG